MSTAAPRPRKCIVVLNDDEWHQLRVAAVQQDTTVQGWLTTVVLAALQGGQRTT